MPEETVKREDALEPSAETHNPGTETSAPTSTPGTEASAAAPEMKQEAPTQSVQVQQTAESQNQTQTTASRQPARATLTAQARQPVRNEQSNGTQQRRIAERRVSANDPRTTRTGRQPEEETVPTVRRERRSSARDFSRPYITRSFELYSNAAQILFERTYPRMDNALYMLCVVIPSFATDAQNEQDAKALEEAFSAAETELTTAIESNVMEMKRRQVPKEERMTSYDHKRVYQVPLRSPFARRYLNIFARYDQLIALIDALWINGRLTQQMRIKVGAAWDRRLRNLARVIHNLRLDALHRARETARLMSRRRREEAVEDEDDDISAAPAAEAADPIEQLEAANNEDMKPITHEDVDTGAADRSPGAM